MSTPEESHLDVLQNIEFAIVKVYRAEPALIDADVQDAVNALVRLYAGEQEGRRPPELRLAERATRVFQATKYVCEWRLGRGGLSADDDKEALEPIAIADLVACVRRIQKSVRRWNREGGRRGYLDFVSQYVE